MLVSKIGLVGGKVVLSLPVQRQIEQTLGNVEHVLGLFADDVARAIKMQVEEAQTTACPYEAIDLRRVMVYQLEQRQAEQRRRRDISGKLGQLVGHVEEAQVSAALDSPHYEMKMKQSKET